MTPTAGRRTLARRVVTIWRVATAVPVAVLAVAATTVPLAVGAAGWVVPAVVVAAGVALVAWLPAARYDAWSWALTDQALELEHGLWRRRLRSLPYFRIQHIDIEHGPLDRRLGLARLEVHTASVTAVLPGIVASQAPGLRSELLGLAADAVGEVVDGDADAV